MEDRDDTGPSSIVARADALMQRRRQASAAPREGEELPVLTEVVDPDEDLPVLGEDQAIPEEIAEAAPPALDPALIDLLAHELTRRVHERLAAEIPSLVEASLQSILAELTQCLQAGIEETTEGAIRDFLSERDQLAKLQRQR